MQGHFTPQPPFPDQQPPQSLPPQKPVHAAIDPGQIPSAVQDNTQMVEYHTDLCGVPPVPGSRFWVFEENNCSPRYMRSSLYNIPASSDLQMQSYLPLGLLVQPMAEPGLGEAPIPLVDLGAIGPIRCGRCRAYINAFNTFVKGGAYYVCALCTAVNDVPQPYFNPLDPTGRRIDAFQRPELCRGSYEVVATDEYIKRPPMPPVWVFVVDVSAPAIGSGLPLAVTNALQKLLEASPESEPARVAIVTFDAAVHFYQVTDQEQPRMLVMSDIDDPFVPFCGEGLVARYWEAKPAFDSLLSRLVTLFPSPTQESALGSALQAAYHLLEETGGKVFLFASSLPVCGMGALKSRNESFSPGSEQESGLFRPQTPFYTKLAETCVNKKVSVDLFLFAQNQFDLATIGEVAKGSGGHIYYYPPGVTAVELQKRLHLDLTKNLARRTGYDALMRVRCSTGLSVRGYEGHLRVVEGQDVDLPTLDADKTIAVLLQHDETLPDKSKAIFQAALLYTTHQGQRRIRVHTLQLPVTSELSTAICFADVYTSVGLMARHAIKEISRQSLQAGRNALVTCAMLPLYAYRKNSKSIAASTQLVLPDSLQLLPALTLGLLKNPIFRMDTRPDERMALFANFNTIPLKAMPTLLYPNLFPLHNNQHYGHKDDYNMVVLPPAIRLSTTQMENQGAYLLDDGRYIYLWCGPNIDPQLLEDLTGSPAFHLIDPLNVELERDNEVSRRLFEVISALRERTPQGQVVQLALPGTREEFQFFASLVEDKSQQGMSYVDFLCQLHKHIQKRMAGDESTQMAIRAMVEMS